MASAAHSFSTPLYCVALPFARAAVLFLRGCGDAAHPDIASRTHSGWDKPVDRSASRSANRSEYLIPRLKQVGFVPTHHKKVVIPYLALVTLATR